MHGPTTYLLSDKSTLQAGDAVAAVIVTSAGRYLLQLRDDIPGIFYPGHWGCFGGAMAPGETLIDCLARELAEELEFRSPTLEDFVRFDFDLSSIGLTRYVRAYYVVHINEEDVGKLVLHEGAEFALLFPEQIFLKSNIVPYDSFAIWLHVAGERLS